MIFSCICGGWIEVGMIFLGLGVVYRWVARKCRKRGCGCICHKERNEKLE